MKISVVIPLYNKAETILRAVQSVQAQTWHDWELIVVDDGSSDDGAERVNALRDERIRVIRQRNAGVSVARNVGVESAQAEWVALLDADDYWTEHHLARLVALHERFPKAVLLGTSYCFLDDMGLMRGVPVDSGLLAAPDGLVILPDFFGDTVAQQHLAFTSSSVMLPRALTLKVGGFPPGVTAGEDQAMWARLACEGQVALSLQRTSVYVEPVINAENRLQAVRRPATPDVVGQAFKALRARAPDPRTAALFISDWHRIRAVAWMELNERARCLEDLWLAVRFGHLTRKDLICLFALILPLGPRTRLLARRRENIRRKAAAEADSTGGSAWQVVHRIVC